MSVAPLLLTTKLYLPAVRPDLVGRPRLLARLADGLTRPLTLISAPAGFGKTTLISEWHASEKGQDFPLAWLALDDDDNDSTRFLTYLIAALATLKPGFGEPLLALLQSPQPSPPKLLITHFINEISNFSTSFGLVLDDYHAITNPALHEALAFLLEHIPPPMHVIITTRADPPLPLARFRARRQLAEIRGDELRFTSAEAAAFLNQIMGLNLSAADIAVLEARTEGWIAGLQMAALSMQGREDIASFINSFGGGHRFILDYLVDDVLRQQPEDIQQFLLQTSLLNHLSGPLCDAILGKDEEVKVEDNSSFILEYLEQANLFLVPLDNERHWYRYHHLFAEALRHRLHTLQPEQVSILHQRASQWHEQQGLLAEAIQHALNAQDFTRAAHLVEGAGQALLMRGEMATVLKWLNILPEELLQTRPQLCLFHAWTLILNGQVTEAEDRLRTASELGVDPAILGQAAAIRALIALFQGNIQHADELTRQAGTLLPAGDSFGRGITALNLGVPYLLHGDVETARHIFAEVAEISLKSGNLIIAVIIQCQIAEVQIWQGQLHQALATYRRALALATTPEAQQLSGAGQAHIGLAAIWYEWNDLAVAAQHLAEGFRLGRQLGEIGAFDAYMIQVNLKYAQGDLTSALEALEQAEQLIQKFSPLAHRNLTAYRARLWVKQGNWVAAGRWAAATLNLPAGSQNDLANTYHFHEFEQLTLARILTAQASAELPTDPSIPDDPASKALQLLEALYPEAVTLGRGKSIIEILLLQALAKQVQGNVSQAMNLLRQALTLAQPEGFVRLFVDEGPPVASLLERVAARDREAGGRLKEYIHKLLAAFSDLQLEEKQLSIVNRQSEIINPLIEPLSERELEILQLIAAGQSNEEIAQTLVIALGTVKRHINNIYGKLDVHSRTQALAQAKALNLLP